MDFVPDLDVQLAALLDEVRTETESIWCWQQGKDGTVTVLLIEADRMQHARRMEAVGLAGGEGRCLRFQQVGGRWNLVGQARWIG